MLGMDFPHHEGTLVNSTKEYLRATLGAQAVPEDEARRLLGLNAIELFGFDEASLRQHADRISLRLPEVLTPPDTDLFARGDVHKPLHWGGA
jgi:hypothetical protein